MMTITNKMVVKAKAAMFIIPNRACLVMDYLGSPERAIKAAESLCAANHTTFNADHDRLVQTWIVAEEDLGTENLGDHGFRVEINGIMYHCNIGDRRHTNIPQILLKDKKEDEWITLILPDCKGECRDDENEITFDLELSVQLKQLDYRYRRFGRFEEVLEAVC